MKRKRHRLLSLLLIVTLVLGLMPAVTLTASAASNLEITEDTTLTIAEGATYTIQDVVFNNSSTLTITGGGTLVVENSISATGADIAIHVNGSGLEAPSIMPEKRDSVQPWSYDEPGIKGNNVTLTVDGNSSVNLGEVTGGYGSDSSENLVDDGMEGTFTYFANAGNGGDVTVTINGGFVRINNGIAGGEPGLNMSGNNASRGKASLQVNGGFLYGETIEGGAGSTVQISAGSMYMSSLNGIQPTTNGTDRAYYTRVTLPDTGSSFPPATYTLDGGSSVSTISEYGRLHLWLIEGSHTLQVTQGTTKSIAEFTAAANDSNEATAAVIPLIVTNGGTSTHHTTWASAAAAVDEGSVITLLQDVTMQPGDVLPSVSCTIDGGEVVGGTGVKALFPGSANLNMQANLTLKNMAMGMFGFDNATLVTGNGATGYTLTLEGTIPFADNGISGGGITGSGVIVKGQLDCSSLAGLDTLQIDAGGSADVFTNIGARNVVNNGSLTTPLYVEITGGTLSGSGDIILSGEFDQGRLWFQEGASLAPASAITLKTDFYTPAQGHLVAKGVPASGGTPAKVSNIDRLLLDSAFGDLMLAGAADTDNNYYKYTLAPALAQVTNGQSTTRYASWNEASEAVLTGGVITLLRNVDSSEIGPMPSVPYTIDGDGHTISGGDIYLNADAILKDFVIGDSTSFFVKNGAGDPVDVIVEETVTGSTLYFNGNAAGSVITVRGNLTCGSIDGFETIRVEPTGTAQAYINKAKNVVVNGTLKFDGFLNVDGGQLTGAGSIVYKANDAVISFENSASLASDANLILKAEGFAPVKGQRLLGKVQDGVQMANVGRLTLGEGFSAFALDTDNLCGNYSLIDVRSFTLPPLTTAYTGEGISLEAAGITPALGTGEAVSYTYYPTEADRTAGANGSDVAPVNVGTYYGRAVIAKSADCTTAQRDATLIITKASGLAAPANGVVHDDDNLFQFTPMSGHTALEQYEYSFDGTSWTALTGSNAFVDGTEIHIQVGNVAGTVKVRLKETANYEAGAVLTAGTSFVGTLEGNAAIAGTSAYGQILTAQASGTQPGAVLAYQWKRTLNSIITDVGAGSTYTLGAADIGATLAVTVTAGGYNGDLVSQATAAVSKAVGPAAPLAPVFSSAITDSITLASISGAEYQRDGEPWQDSPVFSGLSPASGYAFRIRIKETPTHLASAISPVRTLYTRSVAPADTVVTLNYGAETLTFDGALYEMSTTTDFTGASIANGGSIAGYPGQTLYIRTRAVPNGALESAATAVTIPARTVAPAIASIAGTLGTGVKVTAAVNMTDSGSFVYRVNQGPWQASPEFAGLDLDTAYVFEAAYVATATAFASAADSESKIWTGADFTAEQVAALVTSITPPAKDAASITLPTVPAGFTVTIKSVTPDTTVLAASGTIAPPAVAATVKVVLMVTKTGNSTTADTTELTVVIPAKTPASASSGSGGGGGGGGYSQPAVPAGSINSGKDLTQTDLKQLASKGGTLTVNGQQGASLVFDAEALKGISGQAGGSIRAAMQDVSAQYQTSHPGRVVYSLTVTSEGKTISQFGGSVAVTLPYILKQGEDPARVTIWHLAADGTLTEIPCSYDTATGRVTFKVSHFSLYTIGLKQVAVHPGSAGSARQGFSDVNTEDWFKSAVQYVTDKGLMAGTDAQSFGPHEKTTRAMIVTILWRMEGKPTPSEKAAFADVPEGEYYAQAVAWAAKEGIVSGQSTDRFAPQQSITREQLAALLFRYAQYKKQDTTQGGMAVREYADYGSISDYAAPAVAWTVHTGLLTGSDNQLMPGGNATRAQVAAVLQRFLETAH